MQRCTKCGNDKPECDFNRDGRRKSGLQCWCRDCTKSYGSAHRSKPEVREKDRQRRHSRRHDPCTRGKVLGYFRNRHQDPVVSRLHADRAAARTYGIPIEEVVRLRAKTHCDCCGQPLEDWGSARNIDHCHETGKVRGMVCRECNLSMRGPSEQCIARLRCCVSYLEKHRGHPPPSP